MPMWVLFLENCVKTQFIGLMKLKVGVGLWWRLWPGASGGEGDFSQNEKKKKGSK